MKNGILAFSMFAFITSLPCGTLLAEKPDDLIAQFLADRRQGVEKAADDPVKFREFIAAQKDVNARYNNGETLLHYAANRGYMDIAVLLVNKGADINARKRVRYSYTADAGAWYRLILLTHANAYVKHSKA